MKATIFSIIVAIFVIGGALLYTNSGGGGSGNNIPVNNVSIVDGKQIIEINAKGGYQPRKSSAKANLPTVLRFNTLGTYDCSIAVRLSSLSIAKNLPSQGTTDIDIGIPKVGVFRGTCAMGMYSFEVLFEG